MAKSTDELGLLYKYIRTNKTKAIPFLKEYPELSKQNWQGDKDWIPGSTALHWAAHYGQLGLAKLLLEYGATLNADEADWWARPIDWAVDSAQYEVATFLIDTGADLGGDRWSNCTPLHVVAQGGSTNGKDPEEAYRKTASLLIEAGVELNALVQWGGKGPSFTALDEAIRVGNRGVEAVLKMHGAKRNQK